MNKRTLEDWQTAGCSIVSLQEASDRSDLFKLGDSVNDMASRVGLTSGGYDPVHPGHISCISDSRRFCGMLIVVVNGDGFLKRKKGKAFMPLKVRCQIMSMIKGVDLVVPFNPSRLDDDSVCEAIDMICPDLFFKGGDRNIDNIPEKEICDSLGIEIAQGMGDEKFWSSSDFLKDWSRHAVDKLLDKTIHKGF